MSCPQNKETIDTSSRKELCDQATNQAKLLEGEGKEKLDEISKGVSLSLRLLSILYEHGVVTKEDLENRLFIFRRECPVFSSYTKKEEAMKKTGMYWFIELATPFVRDTVIVISVATFIYGKFHGWW